METLHIGTDAPPPSTHNEETPEAGQVVHTQAPSTGVVDTDST